MCQACGAVNGAERERCARCHHKLLVLSGGWATVEEEDDEPSFEEHLLERISILEEGLKRTTEMIRDLLDDQARQERNVLINGAGLASLEELLEQRRLLERGEWSERWRRRTEDELTALERRDRFLAARERMVALHRDGGDPATFRRLLDEVGDAFSRLDGERALEGLDEAWRLDRENPELGRFLGETRFEDGDQARALEIFERLLASHPDHYEALVFGGLLHHERGAGRRAQDLLERALEVRPDAFLPRVVLGSLEADAGHRERAVTLLEEAVEIEAAPEALYLLGKVSLEAGHPGTAIRHLRAAVAGDPALEQAHYLLGLACLERGWHRKALEAFRGAQRLNPRKLRYRDLVRYLSGQEDLLPRLTGPVRHRLEEAEGRHDAGDRAGALEALSRGLEIEPDHPILLLSRAVLCLELGRGRQAEAASRRLLALAPGDTLEATASVVLIESLRGRGALREALRIGRSLLERAGSEYTRTIACYEMAYNLAEMERDLDRALDYARRSLEHAPDELAAFPLAVLGWVHFKRGELDEAIDHLVRSSEIGPSASTLTHLGMALLAAGRDSEAREVLEHARGLSEPAGDDGGELGGRMMSLLRQSARLLDGVRRRREADADGPPPEPAG